MTKVIRCKYCGSDEHSNKDCHMVKWVNYLTGKTDCPPKGRKLAIIEMK